MKRGPICFSHRRFGAAWRHTHTHNPVFVKSPRCCLTSVQQVGVSKTKPGALFAQHLEAMGQAIWGGFVEAFKGVVLERCGVVGESTWV